jgi:tyrosyl-tRNA synthetase
MDLETRIELIKKVGEEIITEQELRELLQTKEHPIAYDGFEPSGRVHIAQGILRAINVNRMIKAGCKFKMLVADWHAWANNKMGGNLEKIQLVGKYLIEVWKKSGMDLSNVEFVWVSDYVEDEEYWKKVMQVARNSTLQRIVRCSQIMGRSETETLSAAQILYPCMQCADIFHLKSDITQLGMDQRKVNVLAREVGPKIGFWKPVVVSHHMLMGLVKPSSVKTENKLERTIELKMSKSNPDSAIFMDDSKENIKRKIDKAYCPEKIVEENPILEYCKYIIFEKFNKLEIERPVKFGGNLEVSSYEELEKLYRDGKIHPLDLKNGVAEVLNKLVEPIKEHFKKDKKARDLFEEVKSSEW